MAVSIQQAAANALAAYLTTALSGVVVEQRWPDPAKALPAKAVTILLSGRRKDQPIDYRAINVANVGGTQATSVWQFAFCEQDLQLDVWATSDVVRDDIIARLDTVLNAGQSQVSANADPVSEGVILALADGWTANGTTSFADFQFDGPDIDDSPNSVIECEFRGTYRGTVSVILTATATTARQAQIVFEQSIDQSTTYDKTTITTSGESNSSGPE